MNPPLRTAEDAAALVEGVVDGTVDAIVTDHAPHVDFEKDREFELAPFGMIGLETSLALVITHLVAPGSHQLGARRWSSWPWPRDASCASSAWRWSPAARRT